MNKNKIPMSALSHSSRNIAESIDWGEGGVYIWFRPFFFRIGGLDFENVTTFYIKSRYGFYIILPSQIYNYLNNNWGVRIKTQFWFNYEDGFVPPEVDGYEI